MGIPIYHIGARVREEEGFPFEVLLVNKHYVINLGLSDREDAQIMLNTLMEDFFKVLGSRFKETGGQILVVRE